MPIRLRDADVRVARVTASLEDISAALAGTLSLPTAFSGAITGSLAAITGSIRGQFTQAPNRTGTLVGSLGAVTSNLRGTFTAPATLASPGQPTLTQSTLTAVQLDWPDNSPVGLANYKIWRSLNGGAYTVIQTITGSPPVSAATDSSLTRTSAATYYITAGNGTVDSNPSPSVTRPAQWLAIPTPQTLNRTQTYPYAHIANVKATYLIDPGSLASNLQLTNVGVWTWYDGSFVTGISNANVWNASAPTPASGDKFRQNGQATSYTGANATGTATSPSLVTFTLGDGFTFSITNWASQLSVKIPITLISSNGNTYNWNAIINQL